MSWSVRPEPTVNQKALDGTILRRLAPFAAPERRLLMVLLMAAPLLSLTEVLRPYLVKLAIDEAIPTGNGGMLGALTGVFFALLVAEGLLIYWQNWGLQFVGMRMIQRMREALFGRIVRQTASYLQARPSGVLVTRLTNDLESISEFFAAGIVSLFTDVLKLLAIAAILVWMNAQLTLAAFIAIPFLWLLGVYFRNRLRESYRDIRQRFSAMNGFAAETLGGIETIQSVGIRGPFRRRFERLNAEHQQANMQSILYDAALYSIVEALGSIATGALLWYGGGLRESGSLSFGELVAFIEYIGMFFEPIRDLSQKYAVMQSAMASGERIVEMLDAPMDIPDGTRLLSAGQGIARIELREVSFGYRHGDEPIVRGISMHAQAGQKIAIVGATGSGKTTLLRLLLRQYDVWQGQVLIEGLDVRQYRAESLRARMAVVTQNVYLFGGTLRDNLRLYDPSVSDADLERVAADVGLTERFASLDSPLHESGANLSLGEKQLISLARALVRVPDVLILDEATSAIDPILEKHVYDQVRRAAHTGILISVAHRLSTVMDADRIYVMRRGVVVEQGSHRELVAQGGFYARLMELQSLQDRIAGVSHA